MYTFRNLIEIGYKLNVNLTNSFQFNRIQIKLNWIEKKTKLTY